MYGTILHRELILSAPNFCEYHFRVDSAVMARSVADSSRKVAIVLFSSWPSGAATAAKPR